ncbi:MAG TPA: glycoside hydrolase family 43 protein [Acidimicrobiales bacterium]|nr:glycoside hydrolase family 43 protein [Acidimicrobiales bacterium]
MIAVTQAELLQRLRAAPRARVLRIGAAVVAVVLVAGFVVAYRQARADLAHRRTELADARADLATAEADLDRARQDTAQAERSTGVVGANIDTAVAVRTQIEASAHDTLVLAGAADAARVETDAARMLVVANAAQTQACFDGVALAVGANRGGHGQAAIDALRGSAGACTRTLAFATGARFPYDFADPYVLRAGRTYYGYSTNAGAGDIQVIRSHDLVTWELVGNGLAALPRWADPDATWAPSVLRRDGRYVVYYTVRERASGLQCISRAVASSPAGPFRDRSRGPLVCQHRHGGSIDPSPFVDAGGRAFLLWKSEGRGPRAATLWSQPLSGGGLALEGRAMPLLEADKPFEHGVVEAPTMVRSGGSWFLLYAAADWSSRSYATAYAVCDGPSGPCRKPADGRLLRSGDRLAGPGGVEIFHDAHGDAWAAFHAYSEPNVGYPSSRYLHLAPLRVVDRHLAIDAST